MWPLPLKRKKVPSGDQLGASMWLVVKYMAWRSKDGMEMVSSVLLTMGLVLVPSASVILL